MQCIVELSAASVRNNLIVELSADFLHEKRSKEINSTINILLAGN
jgi:hypothetical protein